MNSDIFNQKTLKTFIIGVIVGGISIWFLLSNAPQNSLNTAEDMDNLITAEEQVKDSVKVFNQNSGIQVYIEKVILNKAGWVAVHEKQNGTAGTILGAQLFDKGEHSGFVDLLRGTIPGKSYYAVLHEEDGDRAFNIRKDLPLLNAAKQPIMAAFQTISL